MYEQNCQAVLTCQAYEKLGWGSQLSLVRSVTTLDLSWEIGAKVEGF
jgi:hypothetical protein